MVKDNLIRANVVHVFGEDVQDTVDIALSFLSCFSNNLSSVRLYVCDPSVSETRSLLRGLDEIAVLDSVFLGDYGADCNGQNESQNDDKKKAQGSAWDCKEVFGGIDARKDIIVGLARSPESSTIPAVRAAAETAVRAAFLAGQSSAAAGLAAGTAYTKRLLHSILSSESVAKVVYLSEGSQTRDEIIGAFSQLEQTGYVAISVASASGISPPSVPCGALSHDEALRMMRHSSTAAGVKRECLQKNPSDSRVALFENLHTNKDDTTGGKCLPFSLAQRLKGPLENICLGIGLGCIRFLDVSANTPVRVVPLDVSLGVGFVALCLFISNRFPQSSGSSRRIVIDIGMQEGALFAEQGILGGGKNTAGRRTLGSSWFSTRLSLVSRAHDMYPTSLPSVSQGAGVLMEEGGLVWGMVGEYAVDYFGRYHAAITEALRVQRTHHSEVTRAVTKDLVAETPTIDFRLQFMDLWNYGIHLATPLQTYRRRSGENALQSLYKAIEADKRGVAARSAHKTRTNTRVRRAPEPGEESFAARMQEVVETMQYYAGNLRRGGERARNLPPLHTVVAGVLSRPRGQSKELDDAFFPKNEKKDFSAYELLLRIVARERSLSHLLPYTSLSWVKWERYVKRVCVGVLLYISRRILESPSRELPEPTPMYVNDLNFSGIVKAPEPNLRLRRVFPGLFWALRSGQQSTGYNVCVLPGGTAQRRHAILAQPQVQLLLSRISREEHANRATVESRAERILKGIGDRINHFDLRVIGSFARTMFTNIYNSINISPHAFDILFRAFRAPRTAVVLIPAHRSYVDFIVLSYVLLTMGFPPPHICSGEDFLRLGGVADRLRGCGAFFMRRTFRGDRLYAGLFKEYVRHLVRATQGIEFFIEGYRSRTGKTVPPKLGILKMITDAFFEPQEEIDDVLFIPVGLSYEKLLEENVYADELLGIPKPKETVWNLLKSAAILKKNYGSFNINVSTPISLRELARDPLLVPKGYEARLSRTNDKGHGGASSTRGAESTSAGPPPSSVSAGGAGGTTGGGGTVVSGRGYTPSGVLTSLSWWITYKIQRSVVVTPTAVLSALVLSTLDHSKANADGGIPLAVLSSGAAWLRGILLARGGRMDNSSYDSMDGEQLVLYALRLLEPRLRISSIHSRVHIDAFDEENRLITGSAELDRAGGAAEGAGSSTRGRVALRKEPTNRKAPTRRRRYFMPSNVSPRSVSTKVLLSIYANQLLHLFADEAVVLISAFGFGREHALSNTSPDMAVRAQSTPADGIVALPSTAPITVAFDATVCEISLGELFTRSLLLRDMIANDLPNFLPSSPVDFNSWFFRTLEQLHFNDVLSRMPLAATPAPGVVLAEEEAAEILCVQKNSYSAFAAYQLYPYIETLFFTILTVFYYVDLQDAERADNAATQPCTSEARFDTSGKAEMAGNQAPVIIKYRVTDAALTQLVNCGILHLYGRRLLSFAQSAALENVKMSISALVRVGLLQREASPIVAYTLAQSPTASVVSSGLNEAGSTKAEVGVGWRSRAASRTFPYLRNLVATMNAFRFQPALEGQIEKMLVDLKMLDEAIKVAREGEQVVLSSKI